MIKVKNSIKIGSFMHDYAVPKIKQFGYENMQKRWKCSLFEVVCHYVRYV